MIVARNRSENAQTCGYKSLLPMVLANHFNSIYIGILYSDVHAKSYPHRGAMPLWGGGGGGGGGGFETML